VDGLGSLRVGFLYEDGDETMRIDHTEKRSFRDACQMKTRTKHTSGVLFFCLLPLVLSLASCSRQAPPKVAKPVANAPVVASNELSRMPVVSSVSAPVALRPNAPKHPPPSSARTPESSPAVREQQKAMRERQAAYVKKRLEEELAKRQAELARYEHDAIRAEYALRAESDMALALSEIRSAATCLEDTCVRNVPGFADMLKEKAALDVKLGADLNDSGSGSSAALGHSEALSAKIGEARRKAAAEIPEVAEAYRLLSEKEDYYQQLLAGKEKYRSVCEKADVMRQEILVLRNRSADQ
jgi:hypothetical protein